MPIPFTGKCDFVYDSEGDTPCRDLLLPVTEEEANKVVSLEWPPGFRFGAATSAYQVEGGIVDTNWNRWEDMRVRPDGKETVRPNADTKTHGTSVGAGKATDMWNLFESVDLPMIKQLGLSTFRFSVEWSRVQPKRDVFDHAAIERYARWCRLLRAESIEPMVTLLHFTEPGWFEDLGGWESPEAAEAFGEFARFVAPRLAPHCGLWCTLNEPVGCALNANPEPNPDPDPNHNPNPNPNQGGLRAQRLAAGHPPAWQAGAGAHRLQRAVQPATPN